MAAASGLFAPYITNFGHYNKIYGSHAAVIIFLLWLWISDLAIAGRRVRRRTRTKPCHHGRGTAASQEPYVQLRHTGNVPSQLPA
jgi:membrane protein